MKALGDSASSVQTGQTIAIAPEGSRSKTGLLLPFKKGPFYLWEKLQPPIVPLLIIGAFDLYPPGKHLAISGKVYVQYLKPIHPNEANSRDAMSRLVRRRMLEALRDSPSDAACELTWRQKLVNVLYLLLLFVFLLYLIAWAPTREMFQRDVLERHGISWRFFFLLCLLVVMGVTLCIYFHVLYISPFLRRSRPRNDRAPLVSKNDDPKSQ